MVEEVKSHLKGVLNCGVTGSSDSPFASSVVLVRKKLEALGSV